MHPGQKRILVALALGWGWAVVGALVVVMVGPLGVAGKGRTIERWNLKVYGSPGMGDPANAAVLSSVVIVVVQAAIG